MSIKTFPPKITVKSKHRAHSQKETILKDCEWRFHKQIKYTDQNGVTPQARNGKTSTKTSSQNRFKAIRRELTTDVALRQEILHKHTVKKKSLGAIRGSIHNPLQIM